MVRKNVQSVGKIFGFDVGGCQRNHYKQYSLPKINYYSNMMGEKNFTLKCYM